MSNCARSWHASEPTCHEWRVDPNDNNNDQLTSETGTSTTTYLYDANGSLTNKIITGGSSYAYTYDVQNRLSSVTVDSVTTTYLYDYTGIRVKAGNTRYLIDPINPTGYAQVLEEWTGGTLTKSYIIGDDVIGQAAGSTVSYLLYDGHGSTRQLSQPGNTVVEQYNYDAYGVGLSLPSSPLTAYLFAGEQWDANAQQYYLRSRWYDPSNGRFNQMDTFAGNNDDPQSLHKYLYAHDDPVNAVDPSGQFTLLELVLVVLVAQLLVGVYAWLYTPEGKEPTALEKQAIDDARSYMGTKIVGLEFDLVDKGHIAIPSSLMQFPVNRFRIADEMEDWAKTLPPPAVTILFNKSEDKSKNWLGLPTAERSVVMTHELLHWTWWGFGRFEERPLWHLNALLIDKLGLDKGSYLALDARTMSQELDFPLPW